MGNLERIIDSINGVNDIKKISQDKLPLLAKEIRGFLLENISKTGGHLASNLGVVELTMALHYVLDLENDKIVWDVGHQAYTHKILTGRKNGFKKLRQLDGLSGFPKPLESKFDSFATGHSSTSISAALGMAIARDLKGGNETIAAVIGDGSMTGGLAYEALNNAGRTNTNILVILNDNQMSISNNVGALSRHLNDLRTAQTYINAKAGVHKFLAKVPVIGKPVDRTIEKIKDGIKYLFVSGIMFEELGFNYVGPVNGHDFNELIDVLNNVKKINGPVLLHVRTIKGKGYRFAEKLPWEYHGVGSFNIKTGCPVSKGKTTSYSNVFGKTIVELAEKNENIVAISAAMTGGTCLEDFQLKFHRRFFDVGIAEQHAVTFAAGIAASGFIPVFAVYSTFLQRAYDELITDVALQNLHVIFAIDRAGIVGADGETHQGVFDISYMSGIPNLTIMAPSGGMELKNMLENAIEIDGPVAIRYPRGDVEENWNEIEEIPYGKSLMVEDGELLAILSCGSMLQYAKEAVSLLKEKGYSPMLVDIRFIKPVDKEMIEYACEKCKYIFTVEDNILTGGFGTIVQSEVCGMRPNVLVKPFGFPDSFIEQGTRPQLFERYKLDGKGLYNGIIGVLEKENS